MATKETRNVGMVFAHTGDDYEPISDSINVGNPNSDGQYVDEDAPDDSNIKRDENGNPPKAADHEQEQQRRLLAGEAPIDFCDANPWVEPPETKYDLTTLLELHKKMCAAARETMYAKNNDYTCGSANVFANFEGSKFLGVPTVIGIEIRLMDKLKRIQTFVEQGSLQVKGESVADAVQDSINYLVLIQAVINQETGEL